MGKRSKYNSLRYPGVTINEDAIKNIKTTKEMPTQPAMPPSKPKEPKMIDKIDSVRACSSFELRLSDDELSVRLDIDHGDNPMSYEIVAVNSDDGLMIRRIND